MLPNAHGAAQEEFVTRTTQRKIAKQPRSPSTQVFRVYRKLTSERRLPATPRALGLAQRCHGQGIGGRDYRVWGYICVIYYADQCTDLLVPALGICLPCAIISTLRILICMGKRSTRCMLYHLDHVHAHR
jgi:hypothetical protein